jgi:hypothetical protein
MLNSGPGPEVQYSIGLQAEKDSTQRQMEFPALEGTKYFKIVI